MTAAERSALRAIRDLQARNAELERKNRRLHALLKASCTMRRRALDQARYLHGVLLAAGVKVPR